MNAILTANKINVSINNKKDITMNLSNFPFLLGQIMSMLNDKELKQYLLSQGTTEREFKDLKEAVKKMAESFYKKN